MTMKMLPNIKLCFLLLALLASWEERQEKKFVSLLIEFISWIWFWESAENGKNESFYIEKNSFK